MPQIEIETWERERAQQIVIAFHAEFCQLTEAGKQVATIELMRRLASEFKRISAELRRVETKP